ncbi:hypothetical protein HPB50_029389 [Hyalomma asiaticum]|nr:hypothetical protein HPB50_029389 [Hyalomma asiaticum]
MKDQKRRRTLKAHFSKDTSQTTSTRHSVSAEPLRLSGAAVHSDAAQATPARAAPGKEAAVFKRAHVEAESPTTGMASSPPPRTSLRRQELALSDPTDDSFMKDQKRRRTLKAHFSKDTSQTTSTRHSVSAEPLRLSARLFTPTPPKPHRLEPLQGRRQRSSRGRTSKPNRRLLEGEDNTVFDVADSLSEKKSRQKRPTPPAFQPTKNGAHSLRSPGSAGPSQSAAHKDGLADDGAAGTKEKFQYDDIGIEKGCEFARLLSRLICARDEAEYASSDEYSCPTGARIPLKSKRDKVKYPRTGRIMVNTDAVVRGQRGANVPETFPYPCGVISREVRQKSAARKPALAMHTDTGTTKLLQEPRASKRKPLMERFVSKAAARQTPQLLQAVRNKVLDNNKQNIIAEADHARIKRNVKRAISETESGDKITLARQSSRHPTASEKSTDGAKYGSSERGVRKLEAVLLSVPQGYGDLFLIEAAFAPQNISSGGASLRLTHSCGNTGEATDISLKLSPIRDILSALTIKPSVLFPPLGTTTNLSAEKPSKEYTTKRLQIPMDIAERPFASALAILQRQATRTWNENTKSGVQDTERLPSDYPPGSAPLSLSQSAIEYKTLDKATTETTSTGMSVNERSMAVASGCVPEMLSSIASTTRNPAAKVPASSKAVETTAVDSHEASKDSPSVQFAFYDWSEGTVPPPESVPLFLVSLTSNYCCSALYRITDLADLCSLEKSVVQRKRRTGDSGAVLHVPLPRITSCSVVQRVRSGQPAFSLTERVRQAQLLPEPAGRSGRLPLTRRRDTDLRIAKDQPCSEDVKSVVMQDNKNYLNHPASRRPTATATPVDEVEYERFNMDGQAQPDLRKLRVNTRFAPAEHPFIAKRLRHGRA